MLHAAPDDSWTCDVVRGETAHGPPVVSLTALAGEASHLLATCASVSPSTLGPGHEARSGVPDRSVPAEHLSDATPTRPAPRAEHAQASGEPPAGRGRKFSKYLLGVGPLWCWYFDPSADDP